MFEQFKGQRFSTILADPPWQFQNRTGKMAPEHRRLSRYGTMSLDEVLAMPVAEIADTPAHLYLWVPNALLPEGLRVMEAWGFNYKSNIVWHKIRKDGGPDGRGVGFYFRNTTELILFGVRGKNARTKAPGRRQVNIIKTQKREHSRKPDELYDIIEACSEGPFLELFARGPRKGWSVWGDQAEDYAPSWATYANHSASALDAGERYSANAVVPSAAQAGAAALSLVNSDITKKRTIKNCLEPDEFIEAAVRSAPGSLMLALEARDAYKQVCAQVGKKPVADLAFWRALSTTALNLGAEKQKLEGRVAYSGVELAA
ncbi:MAG: hypothetical protein KJ622_03750 [Alphaproteobacteria bacterium]|nr:hypothetical protein [Alphaproteobacteria bacterium]